MARNTTHHTPPATEEIDSDTARHTKKEFGRRLQQLALQRGWNQSELARQAGIGRDAVSTWVRGTSFPEPKNLHKLAQALGITPEELSSTARALTPDDPPILEIRVASDHPDKVWLRVNKMVSTEVALTVFNALQADKKKSE